MEDAQTYGHFLQAIIGWIFWQVIVIRRQKKDIDTNQDGVLQGTELGRWLAKNWDNIVISLIATYFALPLVPVAWEMISEAEMWDQFYMFTAVIGVVIQEIFILIDPKAIAKKVLSKYIGSDDS